MVLLPLIMEMEVEWLSCGPQSTSKSSPGCHSNFDGEFSPEMMKARLNSSFRPTTSGAWTFMEIWAKQAPTERAKLIKIPVIFLITNSFLSV